MNGNATMVRADLASARSRAFLVHPASKLQRHPEPGPLDTTKKPKCNAAPQGDPGTGRNWHVSGG